MSRVPVNESILRWALDRSNKRIDDLQHNFPKIRQWFTGEIHPTLRELKNFSKKTLTPLGFFFLEKPPIEELPIPHFRTIKDEIPSAPSPDLIDTIHLMQRRQAWMREYLLEEGQEPFSFIRSARLDEKPVMISQRIRKTLGFNDRWAASVRTWEDALITLREAMEKIGILVFRNGIVGNNTHRKLDPEEFRGFVLVDDYAPLVFVNNADYKAAQMFTLAHELAHVFLGSSAAFDLRNMLPANDPTELKCNKVAAEFLVPETELRQIWPSIKAEPEPFQIIARRFKVSVLVTARRVLDLGLINKESFLQFYRDYLQDERRKAAIRKQGGDYYKNQYPRLGRLFISTVVRATQEGKLLFSEAYRLTGLYGKTFDNYVNSLG
jgi:Zn-dependent peptidase ImmA (M78 family)